MKVVENNIEYDVKERDNGLKIWFKNGKRHRENGPAVIHANGHKIWYKDGKRHREDGPAIEYADGNKSYYYNGEKIFVSSDKEFDKFIRKQKLKAFW